MAPTCSALTCKNRQKKGSGITFHSFPRNEVRRQKWLAAIQRSNWTPPSHAVICSVHFEEKYFDRTGQTVRLRENSVPTLLVSKTSYIRGKRYSSSLCQDKIVEKDAIPEAESENMTEERRNCDRVEKLDMQEHNYPKNTQPSDPGEELSTLETSCFICGNVMMNGTPLHFLTEITKVKFLHKLDNILSELSFVMDEKQILCSRCTRLINYIDHTEVQLSKLHRSIFNCVYARHVKSCPNVELLLPDFIEHNPQVVSLIQEDKELVSKHIYCLNLTFTKV
ncbi:hypothetical protein C0J52_22592 [Blattella germanica]|nr:hypothetical protein C0J52_22592 [Blattella germanica]